MEFKIGVLPGDGIGPEITEQAVKAIDAVCRRFGHKAHYTYAPVGAAAIDSCGEAYPDSIRVSTTIPAPKYVPSRGFWP